jgi:hypothetical protein
VKKAGIKEALNISFVATQMPVPGVCHTKLFQKPIPANSGKKGTDAESRSFSQ